MTASTTTKAQGQPSLFAQNIRQGRKKWKGLVVLFCGLGGSCAGLTEAMGYAPDVAINHMPVALGVHSINSPQTTHYQSDLSELDPRWVIGTREVDILWASPDCTSFSTAAGRAPVPRELRILPWKILPWIRYARPKIVLVENVPNMQRRWGSLVAHRDKEGKLQYHADGTLQLTNDNHPKKRNRRWKQWVKEIESLGYRVDWRILDSADFGAATSRPRLYIALTRDGSVFPWPEATHAPANDPLVQSGTRQPHLRAAPYLDWSIPTEDLFDRKKKLGFNGKRRVATGIKDFLAERQPFLEGGKSAFFIRYFGTSNATSVERPAPTIMASGGGKTSLVTCDFGEPNQADPRIYDMMKTYFPQHACLDHVTKTVRTFDGQTLTGIQMRTLHTKELKVLQSFKAQFIIDRQQDGQKVTKSDQVKLIGNSVPPIMAKVLGTAARRHLPNIGADVLPERIRIRTKTSSINPPQTTGERQASHR